jgi:hypothetical protein
MGCLKLSDWGDSWITCREATLYEIGSLTFRDIAKHLQPQWNLLIHPNVINNLSNKGLLGLTRLKPAPGKDFLDLGVVGDIQVKTDHGRMLQIITNNFELLDAKEALMAAGFKEYAKL